MTLTPQQQRLARLLKGQKVRATRAAESLAPRVSLETAFFLEIEREIVRPYINKVESVLLPMIDKYWDTATGITNVGDGTFQIADDLGTMAIMNALDEIATQGKQLQILANKIAAKHVKRVSDVERAQFKALFNSAVGIKIDMVTGDRAVRAAMVQAQQQSAELIVTLPASMHMEIRAILTKGFRERTDAFSIRQMVLAKYSPDDPQRFYKARRIARDQVSKLNANLNEIRQVDAGVTSYIWRTAQDERVRDSHAEKDGEIFEWDAPPADTGHPGDDIQCRCYAEPYFGNLV